MARVSISPPRTLGYRLAAWVSRRRYGAVLAPAALAHNFRVGWSCSLFELQVQRWKRLDSGLKDLAVVAAASSIGCSWCTDFGYWKSTARHEVMAEKIRAIREWQGSGVFTELERLVMLYAEAMTMTPPLVTDDLVVQLRRHLDETELVELTAIIAVENLRSRMNAALDLTSQGSEDQGEPAGLKRAPGASHGHNEPSAARHG
jgi:alkylhydroperoxidase family enzyme